MTDAQFAALQTEIETDPGERGYAAYLNAGNDTGLAALLNTRDIPGRKTIEPDVLRAALMNLSAWTRLRAIQRNPEAPWQLAAAADTVFDACQPAGLKYINLDAPSATALFAAFVDAEILTAQERDGLLTLADTLISRAEEVAGAGVHVTDDDAMKLRRSL